jgi:hypothetical protein
MTNPSALSPCTLPARLIILRCGSDQSFFYVSRRMFAHSKGDGKSRFWGLAFQREERSASRSSARPRYVTRCLRVSQSRREWTK